MHTVSQKISLAGAGSALAMAICALSQPAFAQDAAAAPQTSAADENPANVIVVTGSTSKRTLLDASVAVTQVNQADLLQKAPRNTADLLETIPGIFVEATAGPVSNNYSVRGLPGGGQQFVRLIEDGMPAIYDGLNDDEVFQYDASIDHVEGLQGGTSGILTPNGAGASINFISRKLNYDEAGGLFKITGTSYGEARSDFWYSAPAKFLGDNVAYAISGYLDSNPGQRDSQFRYDTYHVKFQIEKRWDDGGSLRFTYKRWNEHDPYYADQPFSEQNGKITSVPGLDAQHGNIIGSGFGSITFPDSCAAGECTNTFSEKEGIHAQGNQYRVDFSKPVGGGITLFAKVRYTETDWDFNGVFAGSGTGNAGLDTAVDYLNSSSSPIASLLAQGATAFPGTAQFGIRSLTTGQVIAGSDTAALNALNGNGLLEQTVLNHQIVHLHDLGSDFGAKWEAQGADWKNSLTVGGMIYHQHETNDQSGVATVLNDVTNNSNIYDVVALNSAGSVIGTLTNNGLLSYGDWGAGISYYHQDSYSAYANDEFTWHDRLHFDFGLRYEHEHETSWQGNSTAAAVPAGTTGLAQTNPNAFNGTYTVNSLYAENPLNWTIGVNWTANSHLSFYGRYAHSYQTNANSSNGAIAIKLWEAGVTWAGYGLVASVRPFHTGFDNQSFSGSIVDAGTSTSQSFVADIRTNGVDLDLLYRPTLAALRAFSIHGQATFQDPKYSNACLGTVSNGIVSNCAAFPVADGLTPGRTPKTMFTITPAFDLPHHIGSIYLRYKYIGRIFADETATLPLPSYGVLSIGGDINITDRMNLNVSVDNVTNTLGLTEGNPRQGVTQQVVNGYFYGRGIVGTNAQFSLQYKF
jgi:iron complex outermembrane recepter protein